VENDILASSESAPIGKRVFSVDRDETRQPEESYFRDLACRILGGETACFEEIVALHRQHVFHIAWRMAQNYEDALDITQEVFLRAFRALRSWHGRARFSTWLHRIAVNATIDYIRRQTKYRTATESFEEIAPENVAAIEARNVPHDQPRRLAYAAELRREILAAVRRLPRRQRQAFVLRHYHECSIRDIAAVLNITEGAVKRHLYRAARRLRKDLAGRLGSNGG